jgi:hypothetical protein
MLSGGRLAQRRWPATERERTAGGNTSPRRRAGADGNGRRLRGCSSTARGGVSTAALRFPTPPGTAARGCANRRRYQERLSGQARYCETFATVPARPQLGPRTQRRPAATSPAGPPAMTVRRNRAVVHLQLPARPGGQDGRARRRKAPLNDLGCIGRALVVRPWGDTRWMWCYGWRDWTAAVRLLPRRQRRAAACDLSRSEPRAGERFRFRYRQHTG